MLQPREGQAVTYRQDLEKGYEVTIKGLRTQPFCFMRRPAYGSLPLTQQAGRAAIRGEVFPYSIV